MSYFGVIPAEEFCSVHPISDSDIEKNDDIDNKGISEDELVDTCPGCGCEIDEYEDYYEGYCDDCY
jgi:hypothetical protein